MSRYRFVFWEPSVSPHKLALFGALAARPEVAGCVYVAQEGLPSGRAAQGWALATIDTFDIRITPDAARIAELFDAIPSVITIHLFSGLRHVPVIRLGLRRAIASRAIYGIMSEPRVADGWRGRLRIIQSWLTERRVRRSVSFILAIGRNGPPWFTRVGYQRDRIYGFAYFLPIPTILQAVAHDRVPAIAYVGRLVPEKGIVLFLDAVETLDMPCRIVVAGGGPLAGSVAARVRALPHGDCLGVIAMDAVADLLANVDVLVQPSLTTDDGWGAVVGEALLAGAKAVATPQVGASILLDDPRRGAVAPTDPDGLAATIREALSDGLDPASRCARARWAAATVSGAAGAARLLAIVEHLLAEGPAVPPFPPTDDAGQPGC